jgi:peptidoglycan/xylan/chitin deacetylase (PgdA/CDA1 family)
MYHGVGAEGPPALAPYWISAPDFRHHLDWLRAEGWTAISADELRRAQRSGSRLPRRTVLLTFDDGLVSFARVAWPELRARGMTATAFVVSGHVGGRADWDRRFGDPAPLLPWEELRRLAGEGVEIGSHTVTHPFLTGLPLADAARELAESRARLGAELGRPVGAVAYPHGDVDPAVRQMAELAGYTSGFTCRPAAALVSDDPLLLPRLDVPANCDLPRLLAAAGF